MESWTIRLHHGGIFTNLPDMDYVGGEIITDTVDLDMMSLKELHGYFKDFEYRRNEVKFYHHVTGTSLDTGLVWLKDDDTVLDAFRLSNSIEKGVDIYVHHLGQSEVGSKVQHEFNINEEEIIDGTYSLEKFRVEKMTELTRNSSNVDQLQLDVGLWNYADELTTTLEEAAREESMNVMDQHGEDEEDIPDIKSDTSDDQYNFILEPIEPYLVESEYEDSEGEARPEVDDKQPQFKQFLPKRDLVLPTLEVGMEFSSAKDFRTLVREHAIKNGYDVKWKKNEGKRITVACKDEACKWKLYGSLNHKKTKWQLKSIGEPHKCSRVLENTQASVGWLASKYLEKVRNNPTWDVNAMIRDVFTDHKINIKPHTAYRFRRRALNVILGGYKMQYSQLRDYALILMNKNPGSHVRIKVRRDSIEQPCLFGGFFVAFTAQLQGFVNGCRRIVGVDGTHLSGHAGGILLTAVTRDSNNQMFPIAMAVVEVEDKETWTWFLVELLDAFGTHEGIEWTFISDRQKGLTQSLKQLIPNAHHRRCVRHIEKNMRVQGFSGKCLTLLWKVAKAYTVPKCQEAIVELKVENKHVWEYLKEIPKDQWCRAYFPENIKCDLVSNNVAEAFNKYILQTRDKPIITMLECIRKMLMRRFQLKKEYIAKYADKKICPKIEAVLLENTNNSRECTMWHASDYDFEIGDSCRTYTVNLKEWTCDCRAWQLTGIPCKHAIPCIHHMRKDERDYVDPFYHISTWKKAYAGIIKPIPDCSMWPEAEGDKIVCPPFVRSRPGRPKKVRIKSVHENQQASNKCPRVGYGVKCSKCNEVGHNKRTCQNQEAVASSSQPKKRGRPRNPEPMLLPVRNADVNSDVENGVQPTRQRVKKSTVGTSSTKSSSKGSTSAQIPSKSIASGSNVDFSSVPPSTSFIVGPSYIAPGGFLGRGLMGDVNIPMRSRASNLNIIRERGQVITPIGTAPTRVRQGSFLWNATQQQTASRQTQAICGSNNSFINNDFQQPRWKP